jgi:hypothetical protein
MPKRSSIKKPRDINQLAAAILEEATSEESEQPVVPEKNEHAAALGKLGGKKGGPARAAKLTPEQRSEIAKKAATARWAESRQEKS